ncbi:hypothetical protein BFC17_12495 [Alteromonas lipolytica]|uniref:Uncharacterized protein n=2 Tax=Alteromonas lipolytica TaxID=1856405 RepID=A0A1E8FJG1_9ALTE|nr:hypothetical protein BFC17_12495 [Alteromonas lipolytica]
MDDAQIAEKAKTIASYNLKDPGSAQFRNIKVSRVTEERHQAQPTTIVGLIEFVCLEVNAKNSYGGYTGFKGNVVHSDGRVETDSFYSIWCQSSHKSYQSIPAQ